MTAQRPQTFASLLKGHREFAGLTQEELAALSGLGARTISDLERGVSKTPYLATVRRLADALDLSEECRLELAASARPEESLPHSRARTNVEGGFLGALPSDPLVARGEELGRVLDALAAVEGGSGRLLFLAGEPGIGKTRLAQETSVEAWNRGFLVAAGRCYEAQSGVPFYPFLEALATLYEEAPAEIRGSIPDRWPPLTRLLPDYFPSRAGTDSVDREESQKLLRAVAGFVREIAASRPVALLLDDLHCADGASIDLLAHLARHTRGERVLILGSYRDVEVGHDHPLRRILRELGREQLVEKIELQRLGREGTAALMSDRLDGSEVSDEFSGLVHTHTDGNPFFTVETLKALVERGDLVRWEGRWVRKEIEHLKTPESVGEAISDRVSRLGPLTRQALEEASVPGQVFDFDDLAAVSRLGVEELEEALEEAESHGLVRAARDLYTFTHALIQQTLYEGLSPARRRRLHASAGEGLEKLGERVRRRRAAELTRHFSEGGSPGRAAAHALIAGKEAEGAFAPGEAERHYRRALELAREADDVSVEARALESLGDLLMITVRYDEALEALERASNLYESEDPESHSRVEASIARTHFRRGSGSKGILRLSAHLETLDRADASGSVKRSLAALYGALARLHFALLDYKECRDAAQRASELSREVSDDRSLAEAGMILGSAQIWLGRPEEATAILEEVVTLSERCGASDALNTALSALYWTHMLRGEFELGREYAARGVSVAEKMGDHDLLAMHSGNLGLQLFYLGDWEEARDPLERGAQLARSGPPSLFSCVPPAYLGVLRQAEGDWEEAERCFSESVASREEVGPEFLRHVQAHQAELDLLRGSPEDARARLESREGDSGWIRESLNLSVLAEALAETGDVAEAQEVADFATEQSGRMHNRVDGLEASRVRAKTLSMLGRREEAATELEAALPLARSMPHPYAEAKLLREYGSLHLREGDTGKARERLATALEIFVRLGAKKDAEQTRRTLAGLDSSTVPDDLSENGATKSRAKKTRPPYKSFP